MTANRKRFKFVLVFTWEEDYQAAPVSEEKAPQRTNWGDVAKGALVLLPHVLKVVIPHL